MQISATDGSRCNAPTTYNIAVQAAGQNSSYLIVANYGKEEIQLTNGQPLVRRRSCFVLFCFVCFGFFFGVSYVSDTRGCVSVCVCVCACACLDVECPTSKTGS